MENMGIEATQETLGAVEHAMATLSWVRFLTLAVLLVACVVVIRLIMGMARRAMGQAKMDRSAQKFLSSGLRVMLWLVALCVLLGYLGVPITSLVAVVGVLGLALSLAVQGLLANLAGGIMLLTARPFASGDFVEAGGVSGTVNEVGLVYTKIHTVDNKVVYVPNGDISTKTIVNYSSEAQRRVDLKFTASYDAPVDQVETCIAGVAAAHPLVLADPEPFVRVSGYGSSAIEYTVRVWCAGTDYWTVYFDLMKQVKTAFDAAGIEMTYDHINVHMMK